MLETEFQFYIDNKFRLYNDYPEKHLVIVGRELKGVFDTIGEAYNLGVSEFGLGNFLIQKSTLSRMSYTVVYYTPNLFELP